MKSIIRTIAICLIAVATSSMYAQSGKLKGTVKDSIGNVVEFANVIVQETKIVTTTDERGIYYFDNIPSGEYPDVQDILTCRPDRFAIGCISLGIFNPKHQ